MPLNINEATCANLCCAISEGDAALVINARRELGQFLSWKDLLRVPGISLLKINGLRKAGFTIATSNSIAVQQKSEKQAQIVRRIQICGQQEQSQKSHLGIKRKKPELSSASNHKATAMSSADPIMSDKPSSVSLLSEIATQRKLVEMRRQELITAEKYIQTLRSHMSESLAVLRDMELRNAQNSAEAELAMTNSLRLAGTEQDSRTNAVNDSFAHRASSEIKDSVYAALAANSNASRTIEQRNQSLQTRLEAYLRSAPSVGVPTALLEEIFTNVSSAQSHDDESRKDFGGVYEQPHYPEGSSTAAGLVEQGAEQGDEQGADEIDKITAQAEFARTATSLFLRWVPPQYLFIHVESMLAAYRDASLRESLGGGPEAAWLATTAAGDDNTECDVVDEGSGELANVILDACDGSEGLIVTTSGINNGNDSEKAQSANIYASATSDKIVNVSTSSESLVCKEETSKLESVNGLESQKARDYVRIVDNASANSVGSELPSLKLKSLSGLLEAALTLCRHYLSNAVKVGSSSAVAESSEAVTAWRIAGVLGPARTLEFAKFLRIDCRFDKGDMLQTLLQTIVTFKGLDALLVLLRRSEDTESSGSSE